VKAAVEAARKAVDQFAFERTAVLYRRALELLPEDDLRRRELSVALGAALSDAGRGQAAAEAYEQALRQDAALAAPAGDRLELEHRAAEQILRAGHIDEGLARSREVLAQVGMRLAKTPRRALATGHRARALEHADAMDGEGVDHGHAFAQAVRAVAAGKGGEALLRAAVGRFVALDRHAFAAAARVRPGEVQSGAVGASNQRAGLAWLGVQCVRNPEAVAAILLPRGRTTAA
jgi:tetratricopeptide (TPR) repeat protein